MTSLQSFEESCAIGDSAGCILHAILVIWNLLLGCLPIIFITADIWRAFKKRKHWIPPVSLVLSSFSLQLLMLLNNSMDFDDAQEAYRAGYHQQKCYLFEGIWMAIIAGRVSVCVFMGCLLPSVARPLSPNMWTDMAALIVSTSTSLLKIAYDLYFHVKHYKHYRFCGTSSPTAFVSVVWWNGTILVSIVVLLVFLCCAATASVGIYQTLCRKIPIILSPQKLNHQFSWEEVEKHIINSFLLFHSFSPKYVLARSILTSPVALITTICNGILIHALISTKFPIYFFQVYLLYMFIILGSGVIFWRCITATIHYPRKIRLKWSSIKQYFKVENFWLSYLEELEGRSLRVEGIGRSRFKKLLNKLWRGRVFHGSLRVLIWMQTFLVVFSKACWLVLQVLFSNKYMERLFMCSASQEFSYLNREEHKRGIVLGIATEFDKHCEALLQLPGECPAGIWIANMKSIEYIKKQMKKGEKEGNKCNELIWLLKNKSSPDFSGEKHVKPHQNYLIMRLEVERELDVCKPSFKMAVVSLVTLMAELASFIPITDGSSSINRAIEACSQAWNIIDIVEDSESEAAMLSKSADKLFQDLHESRTWLGYHLPLSGGVGNSVEEAKANIQNVVDKAQQMAIEYKSRKCEEIAAGYRLYWLSLNFKYQQLTSVEEIVDKMCSELADVVASCIVKAVGVAMNDCKKWAANFEEESIVKAAHVAGKVRNLMENVEWQLKWSFSLESQSVETSVQRARSGPLRKYATFQIS